VAATLTVRDLVLHRPVLTAAGAIAIRRVFVLAVTDGSGLTGLGEAAPLPGGGGEPPLACRDALAAVLPLLTDAFVAGWLERGRPDAPLGSVERHLAETPCARSAVEGALLDLLAQLHGRPLAEELAPGCRPFVPVNALIDPGDGAAGATAALAQGFTTIKLKAPRDPDAAIRLLGAVRGAVPATVRLRLDANAAWTADAAQRVAVAGRGLEYLEQPLAAADLPGLASLRRSGGVPIAVDESVRVPADVGRVGAAQAADVVILKPAFLGGWRPTRQAAQLARSCGMDVVITTAMDGSVGRAHAIHMAAALGLDQRAQGLATGHLLVEDATTEPLVPSGGELCIHARPGLGIGAVRTA
jgi:L-Ala-D/L-Glu epimerase